MIFKSIKDYNEFMSLVKDFCTSKNDSEFSTRPLKTFIRNQGYWATQNVVSSFSDDALTVGDVTKVDDNGTYRTYQLVNFTSPSIPQTTASPASTASPALTDNLAKLRDFVKKYTKYQKTYLRYQTVNSKLGGKGIRYEFFNVEQKGQLLSTLVNDIMLSFPQYNYVGVRENDNNEATLYVVLND